MNSQSIEYQVSLGLQGAQNQVDKLHEALQQSVKVDSTAFKDLERFLARISAQATGLKSKMSDAFKTSNGSKSFLRQYEQLLSMLDTARERMTSLGANDIKFSESDAATIENATNRIKELQKEIDTLNKGKVGNIFQDDSIAGAEQVRKLLADLKLDANTVTFSQLSDSATKELDSVNASLEKTRGQIESLNSQINALNGNKLKDVSDQLRTAVENSTDKQIFKPTVSYGDILDNFYARFSDYKGEKKAQIKSGGSVAEYINKESDNIKNSVDKMIEQYNKYQEVLEKIKALRTQTLKDSGMTSQQKKDAAKDAAISVGISAEDLTKNIDFSKAYTTVIPAIRKMIEDQMKSDGIISPEVATSMRDSMLEQLQHIFDNADLERSINVSRLQQSLKTIFTNLNFDLKDTNIASILQMPTKNLDMDSFIAAAEAALGRYRESLEATKQTATTTADELQQKSQDIQTALQAISTGKGNTNDQIAQMRNEIQQLEGVVRRLIDAYNELTGKSLHLDGDGQQAQQAATAIERYTQSLVKMESRQKALSNIESAVTRWMGFYQVLNLAKRAVDDMKKHIQELDSVMTKIAVVTNMSTNDLWGQIGKYSEIARQYGVAIKGVYEVSQIYYQQGLNKGDVMGLTTETLKMARIAGIDYATAADYMTTAIRGFKLEMADAAHVTDVFSNLAAHTASSTEELATAISKTAASAASVGASFESTSAMMATMIATTRESATNIGTALKSIIARYGEMKASPEGTDSEGEEYSLNKVDKALQTIGISIHNVNGEFRDFDDVILELAEAWDGVDTNTQRYIATVMAGNRQQSRFLSLVSNVEEYKRALELANDSEGAGELQTLKTLDSIDAKIERMKVTIQEFYTSSGLQDLYKGILDTITNVISAANSLPKAFGNIPVQALAIGISLVRVVKNILLLLIRSVQASLTAMKGEGTTAFEGMLRSLEPLFARLKAKYKNAVKEGMEEGSQEGAAASASALKDTPATTKKGSLATGLGIAGSYIGSLLSGIGAIKVLSGMNKYGASTSLKEDKAAGADTMTGGILGIAGDTISSASMGAMLGSAVPVIGTAVGAIGGAIFGLAKGLITNAATIKSASDMMTESTGREIELAKKAYEEQKTKRDTAAGESKELTSALEKLKQLEEQSYSSTESLQEYQEYMNQLAESYPNLVTGLDAVGNSTITITSLENALAAARLKTAEATLSTAEAELKEKEAEKKNLVELQTNLNKLGAGSSSTTSLDEMYRLINNSGQTFQSDRIHMYSDLASQFNQWAAKQGDVEQLDLDHSKKHLGYEYYGTDNDWALGQFQKMDASIFYRWYDDMLNQVAEKQEEGVDIGGHSAKIIEDHKKDAAEDYISYLQQAQEAAAKAGNEINFDFLVGRDIESLDDIKGWSYTEIHDSIQIARERIKQYVGNIDEVIKGVNDSLLDAALDVGIQQNLESFGHEKPNEAQDASKYSSLMKFMLGGRYDYGVDWNAQGNQDIISGLRNWLLDHQDAAESLQNIDYTQYRDASDIKFDETVMQMPDWNEYYEKSFVPAFTEARDRAMKGIEEQMNATPTLKESSINDLIDNEEGNGELNTSFINSLRGQLKQYRELRKKSEEQGYYQEAQNYLTNLEHVYGELGTLSSEQQAEISPIINAVDWSDSTTLSAAAEQLRQLGPDFEGLASQFDLAAERMVTNLATQVNQIHDNAKKTIESIEKVADQIGKGAKASDAFDNMTTMLSSYEGADKSELTFDSLYTWDNELKGYVLTSKGIEVWLSSVGSENAAALEEADNALKEARGMYGNGDNAGIFANGGPLSEDDIANIEQYLTLLYTDLGTGQFKEGVTKEDIAAKRDRYIAEYEGLQKEYQQKQIADEDLTWEQFIKDKQETLVAASEAELEMLKALPQSTILSKITSLDFSAIAGGRGGASKDGLQQMLKEALGDSYLGDDWFEKTLWPELLSGKFDALNKALEGTGFKITSSTQEAGMEAQVKQYTDGLNDILNKPQAEWSEETKNLLKDLGKMDTNGYLVNGHTPATLAQDLTKILKTYIGKGNYTLEQYNQELMDQAKSSGFGSQKLGLDLLEGGFDISNFEQYIRDMNLPGTLDDYFNFSTKEFKRTLNGINLNNLFNYDALTNSFKVDTSRDMNAVVQEMMTAFKLTEAEATEKVKAIYRNQKDEAVETEISNIKADDVGQGSAEQLSTLGNAKVGDIVRVDKLSQTIKDRLKESSLYDGISNYIEVTSVAELDSMLASLESLLTTGDLEPEEAAQVQNIVSQLRSKASEYEGIQGIIGKSVSESAATAYATAIGQADNVKGAMEELKFSFNESTKQWEQGTQTISLLRAKISGLTNVDVVDKNALESMIQQLENQDAIDLNSSIGDMIQNYKAISTETIFTFANAQKKSFETVISELGLTANGDGTYRMESAKIITVLADIKNKVSQATYDSLLETVSSIKDEVISTITSGVQFSMSGTSSFGDMQKFVSSYNSIVQGEDITIDSAFDYNTELESFMLSGTALQKYVDAQKEQLKALGVTGKDLDNYIQDQTSKMLRENIDITSYLEAADPLEKSDAKKNMLKAIKQYKDFLGEDFTKAQQDNLVLALEQGGQAALTAISELDPQLAADLSSEDIQTVYGAQINKFRDVISNFNNIVGEVVSGATYELLKGLDVAGNKIDDLGNGVGVIRSTFDMVEVYRKIYTSMKDTDEATTSELNQAYAQILTAQDQKNTDILDALENAAGMTYDALATMVSTYSKKLLENIINSSSLERTGLGTVRIIDWNGFMAEMFGEDFLNNEQFQALSQTPEYAEAYNSWVDSMVELKNYPQEVMQNTADQIQGLVAAKPGQHLNVAYIERALGSDGLQKLLDGTGATLKNGILQIGTNTNITDLTNKIADAAVSAGAIIPEQLAAIADEVAAVLQEIASLISSGIEGNLNNQDAQKLATWAKSDGRDIDLQFTQTAEGLKLSNDSAKELYRTINEIDAIQGGITFESLKESLIQTDDHFKSISSSRAYVQDLKKEIKELNDEDARYAEARKQYSEASSGGHAPKIDAFESLKGNVNMYARPNIDNGDGTYSTILSTSYDDKVGKTDVHMMLTPIPEWAENTKDILTDDQLNEYVQKLMDENPTSIDALLELDAKGFDIDGRHYSDLLIDVKDAATTTSEAFDQEAQSLHEWSDAWETVRNKREKPDNSERISALQEELSLAEEINKTRATTQDDSFNFMSNDIPAAQNNPLNYWNNWAKAYEVIHTSMSGGKGQKGYMGYQDFYNIITEMGNLAEATGNAIPIGEHILSNSEDAADLINKAAGALENVNGDMKINLGDIGIDFAAGASAMSDKVDAGIHDLAQSQIDMLDGMISLLETIVAMEGLQDLDVAGDGIDLGDIMEVHYDAGTADYTPAYEAWRQDMLSKFKDYVDKGGAEGTSDYIDLGKAMEGIKFRYDGGSKTFADILDMDATTLAGMSDDFKTAYTAFLDGMVQASLSDDFNLDNMYESIKTVLANSGIEDLTIDMGEKTFHIGGGAVAVIDWSKKDFIDAAEKALEQFKAKNSAEFNFADDASIKDQISEIQTRLATDNELEVNVRAELQTIVDLATGDVTIKEITKGENKGKYSGTYKGKTFGPVDEETAKSIIQRAEQTDANGFNVSISTEGKVTGTMSVGKATISLSYDENGEETYKTADGSTFKNKDNAIAHCVSLGYADQGNAGMQYTTVDGETYQVTYNAGLGVTYSYNLATGKIMYQGREFPNEQAMAQFITEVEPLMKSQKLTVDKNKSTDTLEVISNDTVTITRDIQSGELKYSADGFPFNSAKDLGSYLFAKKMAEEQKGTGGKIEIDPGQQTTTLEYAYGGGHVTLTVDSQGNMKYSCVIDGATITADTEEGLKAGLAAHAAVKGLNGNGETISTESGGEEGGGASFKYNAGDITIEADYSGAIVNTKGLSSEDKEKVQNAIKTSTEATPLTAEASISEITADASGATVTVTPTPLQISEAIPEANGTVTTLNLTPMNVVVGGGTPDAGNQGTEDTSSTNTVTTTFKTEGKEEATADINAVAASATTADEISPEVETSAPGAEEAKKDLDNVTTSANKIPPNKNVTVGAQTDAAEQALSGIREAINSLIRTPYEIKFKAKKEGTWPSESTGMASGTVGNAMAGGNTLMGELGPELVVQQGRYFVAGQDGAEFVNLAPDAIVFNHLQTEQLLKNGMSNERGRAVTNERVAAAFAHGNVNGGPAMASPGALLSSLKQLRSMWQSLLGASVKDLAGAGGGGGGGGDKAERQAFIKELELWYNWLQKIAELEEKINYEESKRSKIQSDLIPHGQDITKSYLESLEALKEQIKTEQSLVDSQQERFEKRRKQLNEDSPFSQLYTFDENGQLKYQKGKLEEMSAIFETDEYGRPKKTVEEQYEAIQKFGIDPKYFAFDSSGKPLEAPTTPKKTMEDIEKENKRKEGESDEDYKKRLDDAYQTANAEWDNYYVSYSQAFWDKIDADKEEMQSLHDSINEHKEAILQESQARNEILHSIEDNQISVENKVIKALEDQRQRAIDDAKEERDAIEEASNNLIDGLSTQLEKERDMYSKQQSSDELAKLQRQLGILQRSGGSAAQIASLEAQISDKMQNAYFEAQEEEISKLQEATDAQLERLDAQISIMEEALAYEKENGLLWAQVQEIMQGSPESIAAFIKENDSSMWGDSPTQITQNQRDMLTEIQQYTEFRESVKGGLEELIKKFVGDGSDEGKKDTKTEDEPKKEGTPAYANGGLITKTGYIKVHGKEGKPESILSGEDTHALQAFWEKVNADHDAMMELRDSMYEQRNRISRQQLESAVLGAIPSITYDSLASNGDQIIIEQASVNMNVEQLANDYDAERAGQQALNEILRIAKKTKGWNRIGR